MYFLDVDIRDYIDMFAGTHTRVNKPSGYGRLNMNDSDAVKDLFTLDHMKNPTPL